MKDYIEKIGSKVQIYIGDLWVEVLIKDVKKSYGRVRYMVSPVAGTGEVWVENIKEVA